MLGTGPHHILVHQDLLALEEGLIPQGERVQFYVSPDTGDLFRKIQCAASVTLSRRRLDLHSRRGDPAISAWDPDDGRAVFALDSVKPGIRGQGEEGVAFVAVLLTAWPVADTS